MFKVVDPKINFPEMEEKILKFWKEKKIFEKSVESRPKDKCWNFLDGPPFITGLPHYGSLLSSIPKDLFPRFWTMKGYRVRRVWGWDCHGLPAENKVEEKLGIKRKRDIEEKIGVKKFIDECKDYVKDVSSEWEWYVDHIGRWVDFKKAYKTMDTSYMETVMWVFKQMYEKGYIYKGMRVSLYCPHCVTPISNFEVAMDADNYQEVKEPTAVYKYQLKEEHDTYLLAWSTTPWNKLATPALAVNPKLSYVKVKQGKEKYILAKSTLKILTDEPYKILSEFQGSELIGKRFIPHYDFYKIEKGKKAFMVVGGDFVTSDEGTGIVTIAAYGEEDLAVMLRENIQLVLHVDEEGMIKKEVPDFGAKYYLEADSLVIENLKSRNLIYRIDEYVHSVPRCWRCHTRLFYSPQNAWYVNIQKLKEKLKKTNEEVNWFPEHFKYGRYLKSLEGAPDWCISRSRYWGSAVPVWECACGEHFVPESIADLEKASGRKITDLHKPEIDKVTVVCKKCGATVYRVPEVLDSWIEAGSASLAERHYPFEKELNLNEFFPPDFIVEYTGQIRAWFYVLHVIATALFASSAYKNVLVTGVIQGTDGRKMSKNYHNYPDPKEMLQKYGADALRLYLMSSPVMHGEDIRISEKEYRDQVRGLMLILWNVYNFFVSFANVDKWKPIKNIKFYPKDLLNRWILSRLVNLNKSVTACLENYDTPSAIVRLQDFIDDLSKWYLRRSRDKVGPTALDGKDKDETYETLWIVLFEVTKIMAPFTPFLSEEIYKNITQEESVHLVEWPQIMKVYLDDDLEEKMKLVRKICELGHAARKQSGLKVRQPLRNVKCQMSNVKSKFGNEKNRQQYEKLIKDELNVKNIEWVRGKGELKVELDTEITPELKAEAEARDLIRQIQELRKTAACRLDEKIIIYAPVIPLGFEDYIRQQTIASEIICSDSLKISILG